MEVALSSRDFRERVREVVAGRGRLVCGVRRGSKSVPAIGILFDSAADQIGIPGHSRAFGWSRVLSQGRRPSKR